MTLRLKVTLLNKFLAAFNPVEPDFRSWNCPCNVIRLKPWVKINFTVPHVEYRLSFWSITDEWLRSKLNFLLRSCQKSGRWACRKERKLNLDYRVWEYFLWSTSILQWPTLKQKQTILRWSLIASEHLGEHLCNKKMFWAYNKRTRQILIWTAILILHSYPSLLEFSIVDR